MLELSLEGFLIYPPQYMLYNMDRTVRPSDYGLQEGHVISIDDVIRTQTGQYLLVWSQHGYVSQRWGGLIRPVYTL